MAHSKLMLVSLSLTLLAIATAHNGQNITQVQALGALYCSSTGNLNPGPTCGGQECPPLSGAPVTLSCDNERTTLSQALTNASGAYTLVYNTTGDSSSFDSSPCAVFVKLPIANCSALPTTGDLRAPLGPARFVSGVAGCVAIFIARVVI